MRKHFLSSKSKQPKAKGETLNVILLIKHEYIYKEI